MTVFISNKFTDSNKINRADFRCTDCRWAALSHFPEDLEWLTKDHSLKCKGKMNILQEAHNLTSSDRQKEYGHPKTNFPRVAALWSALLGVEITAGQVIDCLILLKVARAAQGYKRDTYVDIAGYARCRERVEDPADVDEPFTPHNARTTGEI